MVPEDNLISFFAEQCAELEYKQEWAMLFPGVGRTTTPISQVPPELAELRQQVELEESRMAEYSVSVRQLFDESVSCGDAGIHSEEITKSGFSSRPTPSGKMSILHVVVFRNCGRNIFGLRPNWSEYVVPSRKTNTGQRKTAVEWRRWLKIWSRKHIGW